jgi:hypothetical protein
MGNVLQWVVYLLGEFYRQHGLWRTVQFYYRARAVTQQNRLIARAQRSGRYWTPTHFEFRAAFESIGFEIRVAQKTYRENSDLIVARKPLAAGEGLMNKAERIDASEIQFVANADRAVPQERAGSRLGRSLIGRRKRIVLFVLLVIVVVIGALAVSHIDTRQLFPLHLDFVSKISS